MISEGDSWFAYPTRFFGGTKRSNVVDHVERARRFNMLRLERNGDEALSMMTGGQRHKLSRLLNEFGDRLDILLFSGGGNDLVGPWDMELFLKRKRPGMTWRDCIRHDRFERKVEMIRLGYLELLDVQREYWPDGVIITHGYDWPIPSDTGAAFFLGLVKIRPWMKPYMNAKGITDAEDQKAIARYMLDSFNDMLRGVAAGSEGRLVHVETLGVLNPATDWLNEIHATSRGYGKIAEKFMREINRRV
jgi:hypothetical protein